MKKIVTWILLVSCLLAGLAAAEKTSLVEALPEEILPVYYVFSYNSMLKVRCSCASVSMRTVANHLQDFRLVRGNGDLIQQAENITYMDYYLTESSPDREIYFFDVIFTYGKREDLERDMYLQIGTSGDILELRSVMDSPEICSFAAGDGSFVIGLNSLEAIDQTVEKYRETFDDADITLYLDGYILGMSMLDADNVAGDFLNHFHFKSISLFTTWCLKTWEQADVLVSLGIKRPDYVPESMSLKKLYLLLGRGVGTSLPDFKKIPALEEIDLILRVPWSGDEKEVLEQISRPVNTCASLQSIHLYSEKGNLLSEDPDLRIWLAAQASINPNLRINGEPVQIDAIEQDMEESVLEKMKAVREDGELINIYLNTKDQDVKQAPVGNQLIILVLDKAGGFERISTDPGMWKDHPGIPQNRLAKNLQEADTLLVVYPEYVKAGTYQGLFDAYRCYTMIEAVNLSDKTLIMRETAAIREPSTTTKLGSGKTSGTYEIDLGLDALAEHIQ